jgi:predicted nucleotidyltransferase
MLLLHQYKWTNCPASVSTQVSAVIEQLTVYLYKNISSVFLHGSLSFGCFNPNVSDIDLMVIIKESIALDIKRQIIEYLLKISREPSPIEMTFVTENQIEQWQHPCPFDLHFCEKWRLVLENELDNGEWLNWDAEQYFDEFLTSHFTFIKQRGICLWNDGGHHKLPTVPVSDFKKFVLFHLEWANTITSEYPVYVILTYCRAYAFLRFSEFLSKAEAADFALKHGKGFDTAIIKAALLAYQSDMNFNSCKPDQIYEFIRQIRAQCGINN